MKGIISINKPSGISSAAVVSKVRRFLGVKAVGHMGTLDPLASGVLIVGVGKACRLFDHFLNKDKVYTAVFEFGSETDTLDSTGVINFEGGVIPSAHEIQSVLPSFVGKLKQIPPQYSAKSVNGQRAYKIARSGGSVQLKAADIEIYALKLTAQLSQSAFEFEVHCSSGTYIRSIARDIAYSLKTFATMTSLIRTRCGKFSLAHSTSLDELETKKSELLIPIEKALSELDIITAPDDAYKQLNNGVKIRMDGVQQSTPFLLKCCGQLFGIAIADESGYVRITTYLKD